MRVHLVQGTMGTFLLREPTTLSWKVHKLAHTQQNYYLGNIACRSRCAQHPHSLKSVCVPVFLPVSIVCSRDAAVVCIGIQDRGIDTDLLRGQISASLIALVSFCQTLELWHFLFWQLMPLGMLQEGERVKGIRAVSVFPKGHSRAYSLKVWIYISFFWVLLVGLLSGARILASFKSQRLFLFF